MVPIVPDQIYLKTLQGKQNHPLDAFSIFVVQDILFYLEKISALIINIFKTNIFRIQLTFGVVNDLT